MADFQREYGGMDWDDDVAGELEIEYEGEPVIVAEVTEIVDEEVVE